MSSDNNIIEPAPEAARGPTREELLLAARQKPVRRFFQFDVFGGLPPGEPGYGALPEIVPDQDGQIVYGGWTLELRSLNELRVLVPDGAEAETVIHGLRTIIDWLERQPELLRYDGSERALYFGGVARRSSPNNVPW